MTDLDPIPETELLKIITSARNQLYKLSFHIFSVRFYISLAMCLKYYQHITKIYSQYTWRQNRHIWRISTENERICPFFAQSQPILEQNEKKLLLSAIKHRDGKRMKKLRKHMNAPKVHKVTGRWRYRNYLLPLRKKARIQMHFPSLITKWEKRKAMWKQIKDWIVYLYNLLLFNVYTSVQTAHLCTQDYH